MDRHILRFAFLLLCFLLTFASREAGGEEEDAGVSQKASTQDQPACKEKQECLQLELESWLRAVREPKVQLTGCDEVGEDGARAKAGNGEVDPVFAVAKSCDEKGAIWHYKYVGAKGKRKTFKGRGKLLFSKHSSPPHGYDYGMKSGICLLLPSAEVSGVEATFDEKGAPQGDGAVSYHDGRVVRGTFTDGRLHGMAREYEPQKNKETNMEKAEKRLRSLALYRHGEVDAAQWILREDGLALFHPVGKEGLTLAIIPAPSANESALYVLGKLDEEDMMVGASKAKFVDLGEKGCLKVPTVVQYGDRFDFDLEVKSKVNAATAKFIRFFETIANEKTPLSDTYRPHSDPPDAKTARRLIEFLGQDGKQGGHFSVLTPDGEGKVIAEGSRTKGDFPVGLQHIKFLSDWRRRDVIPIAEEKKAAAERAEKAREEELREHRDALLQDAWDTLGPEVEKVEKDSVDRGDKEGGGGDDSEGDQEADEDLSRSESLLNSTQTTDMSEEQYESYMNEFLPYESLPLRPLAWAKKIVEIHGRLDDSGLLQGPVTVKYGDGSSLEGLAVDSVLHGIARHLDPVLKKGRRKRYVRRQVDNVVVTISSGLTHSKEELPREVNFVGSYRNGYIDGPGWRFLVGGTFLFGDMKKTLGFTTEHGAYINQDLETCYLGQFVEGKMMSGQMSKIVGGSVDVTGVRVPKFQDPEPSSTVYRYVEQERGKLVDPLVPDITEETWVYVAPSTLGPEAGDGVFAKRDIPENTVVAFYGGMRFNLSEWNSTKSVDPHYWMKVEGDNSVMHLPDELGSNITKYRATLAHKINHSFNHWNCLFHSLDHPRFGLIPAARVVDNVPEGRELLCMYEYEYHLAAPWYQELWRRDIDSDFIYGPFGHRGQRKNTSEPIVPLLSNGTLYNQFYRHAVEVLGLDPVT